MPAAKHQPPQVTLSEALPPKPQLLCNEFYSTYRKTSNIRCTLPDNKIVDHSDVVGASPVGAAPTTSSFSTKYLASMDWTNQLQDEMRNI